ncbi:MAG: hypothetical protein ABR608_05070 [Pseudonocardiaceae bacterium]
MPSADSSTFVAILIIAVVLIVWWRVALILLAAFLIAVLVTGTHEVIDRIDPQSAWETETLAVGVRTGDALGVSHFVGPGVSTGMGGVEPGAGTAG